MRSKVGCRLFWQLLISSTSVVLCFVGGLIEISTCNFDYFEDCGIVDKSSSASRWTIVAEDYSVNSSQLLYSNIFRQITGSRDRSRINIKIETLTRVKA